MRIEYPAKILLAWKEALSGNKEIREWLINNDYPELGLFEFALRNHQESRDWLIDNKHPHLMALINGAEGNPNAVLWLRKHNLDVFEKMAEAADNDDHALGWLVHNVDKTFVDIALLMRRIKNEIERDNNDPHKISLN